MRLKLSLLINIIFLTIITPSVYADPACNAAMGSGAILDVNMNLLKTMNNMAPLRMGSVELISGDDLPSVDNVDSKFICWCKRGPIVLPGIAISFWNNVGIVETSVIPYCFPSLSLKIPLKFGADMSYGERNTGRLGENKISAQTHYLTLNLLGLINEALSILCLHFVETPTTGIDHMSEVYPWWQNDTWAVIFAPDSLLVANPVAQAACFADSAASVLNKPLDYLYWCYGTWGSRYPNTVTVGSGDAISSYALLVARTVSSQFKSLKITLTSGKHMFKDYCQPVPSLLMKKSVVNVFPIHPILYDKRLSIGASSFVWGVGQDMPIKNKGVMTWAVYQKRDCCAL